MSLALALIGMLTTLIPVLVKIWNNQSQKQAGTAHANVLEDIRLLDNVLPPPRKPK